MSRPGSDFQGLQSAVSLKPNRLLLLAPHSQSFKRFGEDLCTDVGIGLVRLTHVDADPELSVWCLPRGICWTIASLPCLVMQTFTANMHTEKPASVHA